MADPLLQLKDIALSLDRHAALNGLNLSVKPGEVHALLGANGAGKSTLALLVMGREGYRPQSGRIRERIDLNGDNARGLIKSRVAVEDEATAQVIGATYGNAAGARGHVDCLEIVRGNGVVSAIPEVRVTHPGAKVTHEAAIGSVDQAQLETLMARGLDPEEAVDVIVRGMLETPAAHA